MLEQEITMYALYNDLATLFEFDLGASETVQAFFSNIAYNLENKKWGSVYPTIMNEFYHGKIEPHRIDYAIAEIKDIKKKLSQTKVSKLIWDFKEPSKLVPFCVNPNNNLDEIFTNNANKKITDIILSVLESMYNRKETIYLGDYYLKEIYNKNIIKKVAKAKNKEQRNTIIKYAIYLLIVIIVKLSVPEEDFNEFFKMFMFSLIAAIILEIHAKSKLNSKIKESEERNQAYEDFPKLRLEKITFRKDFRSGSFDCVLDEINCPKTLDGIKEKLELKKIRNWKADLKEIHQDLGYNEYYANDMIKGLQESNKLEIYELNSEKIELSKEKRGNLYKDNYIYRIIYIDNEIYLLTFFKEQKDK